MIDFDDEFASAADYAAVYRKLGLQVVPALTPREAKAWKRPALSDWKSHQKALVGDDVFEGWFGPNGKHVSRTNIGILTGECSGGVFCLDFDFYKGPEARMWLDEMLDRQTRAGEIEETPTQTTGGGGKQMFFRAPPGWSPPNGVQPVYNIDIRGNGGFVVVAPSMHSSGRNYSWDDGLAPYEVDIATAPDWLCEQLDILFGSAGVNPMTGEPTASGPRVRTETPSEVLHPFGGLADGREEKMTRMVWARVLDLHRECPIGPPEEAEIAEEARELFQEYVNAVHPRINRPGVAKDILLEEEGRGWTLFCGKLRAALRQWDGKVAREAAKLPPKPSAAQAFSDALHAAQKPEAIHVAPTHTPVAAPILDPFIADGDETFEVLSLENLMQLPDPRFLIDGVMIENGLTFIFGAPGCGKSFIALGMALSVAARLPDWWGRQIEVDGPVLYIASEGISDMKYRVSAWCQEMGRDFKSIPLHFIRKSINFTSIADINRLASTVGVYQQKTGRLPAMVVVDTVSRALPGVDENQQKDMTLFIKACDFLRETFGLAVVGVHHEGRASGQMRGSTVLPGASDQIFHVKRDRGSMEGLFIAEKIKADADGWEWTFLLKDVQLPQTGLKPRKSLFAHRLMDEPLGASGDGFGGGQETGFQIVDGKRWPLRDVCQEIVRAIGKAFADGDPWSMSPQSRNAGRYAPQKIATTFPVSVETAEHMVKRWLLEDVLVDGEYANTKTKKRGLKIKNGL